MDMTIQEVPADLTIIPEVIMAAELGQVRACTITPEVELGQVQAAGGQVLEALATGVVLHFPMAGALIPRQRTGVPIPRRRTGRQQITMRMYMSVRAGSATGRWIAPTAATR